MDISTVVPLYNEVDSLPELTRWIKSVMEKNGYSFEMIFVDDGSNDGSWEQIETLSKQYENLRAIKFRRNYGKSAALFAAFKIAKGDVVITLDADLQDSPEEIPELYKMIKEENFDLVSGWKKKRYDPISKTIPTKLFNAAARYVSGIKLHDFNCGLKAYRNAVIKNIEVYGEMHRYIPMLAKWAGFSKIGEKVVQHQARKFGKTKFGVERFINGFLDLVSITFVGKFGKRPMHLFGTFGVFFFVVGFGILLYLSILKIFKNISQISDRPLFFFGILIIIIGSQLFLTGFLAELVVRNSSTRNRYKVENRIN